MVCFWQEKSFKKRTRKHLPTWSLMIPIILVLMYFILILCIINSGVFIFIKRQNKATLNWHRNWNRPFFPALSRNPYGCSSSACWNISGSVRSSSVPAVFRKTHSAMHLPENMNRSSASTAEQWMNALLNWKMPSVLYMPAP